MPLDREFPEAQTAAIAVAPSAPVELSSVVCECSKPSVPAYRLPEALVVRANGFWGDGYPLLAELVVLAHATGHLDDLGIDAFLDALREPVTFDERPGLETETDDERAAIWARLDRLAADGRLRARFVALLRELWDTFGAGWEDRGRGQAEAAAAAWSARLADGADLLELLPEHHIARREPYTRMAREAQREGRLLLWPSVAGRGHIIALPGALSISADAAAVQDPVVARRQAAVETAERLRVLSDPTRLTILAHLSGAPQGVSDLARALHIAQPTASVHLRQLRDAGLVSAERVGARSVYSALPAAVEVLLAEVTERLTRSMA